MPNSPAATNVILVAGFWLGGWAWSDLEPPLRAAGLTTHPVTLPGLDGSGTEGVTLAHHIDAVENLMGDLEGDVVLVGHSGGGAVVQGVIDRRPERVRRVIYVDSGPLLHGVALIPDAVDDVSLPTWDELAKQGSSIEGMDDDALTRFRRNAVAEPAGVASSKVQLTDERRHDVPASVICTSFDSELLRKMIESGQIPSELGSVRDVRFVDLPTGHWPMFSRPGDLAAAVADEARR